MRLPTKRKRCDGRHLSETHIAPQYQIEILRTVIYRRFDMHIGTCEQCGPPHEDGMTYRRLP